MIMIEWRSTLIKVILLSTEMYQGIVSMESELVERLNNRFSLSVGLV